jgi:hypothetical protein
MHKSSVLSYIAPKAHKEKGTQLTGRRPTHDRSTAKSPLPSAVAPDVSASFADNDEEELDPPTVTGTPAKSVRFLRRRVSSEGVTVPPRLSADFQGNTENMCVSARMATDKIRGIEREVLIEALR